MMIDDGDCSVVVAMAESSDEEGAVTVVAGSEVKKVDGPVN